MSYNALVLDRQRLVLKLRFIVVAVLTGNYLIGIPFETIEKLIYRAGVMLAVAVVVSSANMIWMILLKKQTMPPDTLSYYQCIFDLLAVSLVCYQHGATSSAGYLFVMVIMLAGVLLPKRGIMLIAFSSVVLYMAFLLLETNNWFTPLPPSVPGEGLLPDQLQFVVDISIKGFFFFLIAIACSNMQQLLAKMTKESEFLADFNKSIVNMIPSGVMVLDAGRNVVVFNPAMARITLVEEEKAMGNNFLELFPGIDDAWSNAIEKAETAGEEVRMLGATLPIGIGKQLRVNASMKPLKMHDQVLAVVCTIQTATR